jgi:hypothetical protein
MSNLQETSTTDKQPGKWSSEAGPVQTKKVTEAFRRLLWEGKTWTEISGTYGGEERRHTLTSAVGPGEGGGNPLVAKLVREIGERFNWTITADNYKAIVVAVTAAIVAAEGSRPVVDKRITQEERAKLDAEIAERDRERQDKWNRRQAEADASCAPLNALAPSWAAAAIVAELRVDDCDSMTDYYAAHTERYVVIGWRKGKREDFKQLRKAAGLYPDTQHLGPDADKKVEHRDNYSMGKGNYLHAQGPYSSGWMVRSHTLPLSGDVFENGLEHWNAHHAAAAPAAGAVAVGSVTVSLNEEKGGIEIRFPDKPGEDVRSELKGNGWKWSRFSSCWWIKHTDERHAWALAFAGKLKGGAE